MRIIQRIDHRSRKVAILLAAGVTALVVVGCGGGGATDQEAPGSTPSPNAAAGGPVSALNQGPMAIETVKYNPGMADWGEKAFAKRSCTTCHTLGEKKQGPDLTGVAARRTEAWMRKMITDPEWMVKNDPIARDLYGKYALEMANQQVPDQDVDAIIQFLVRESQ